MKRPTLQVQLNQDNVVLLTVKTQCCGATLWAHLAPTSCPVCGEALGKPIVQPPPDVTPCRFLPVTRYWS